MKKRHYIFSFLVIILPSLLFSQNLLNGPECVSFDSDFNRYLVTNYNGGNIVAIDSAGNQSYFKTGLTHCLGNVIYNGVIYVSIGASVRGFDLVTTEQVFNQPLSGAQQPDGIAAYDGILYVADFHYSTADKIFKIDLASNTAWVFAMTGLTNGIQDLLVDAENNRLIVAAFYNNSPIQAVSLIDSSVTNILTATVGNFDGIARDNENRYYLSTWTDDAVYRYDADFTNPPELFAGGFNGPSNLSVNLRDNILAVPSFDGDRVDYISIGLNSVGKTETGYFPGNIKLFPASPNPFNSRTNVRFSLQNSEKVSLILYNLLGVPEVILLDDEFPAGEHTCNIDAYNLASGTYFVVLSSGDSDLTEKLVLLK